jgi:hypothetical protein
MKYCNEEMLFEYAAGETDAAGSEQCRLHLDDCPACRAEFDRMVALRSALVFKSAESEEFVQSVMNRVLPDTSALHNPSEADWDALGQTGIWGFLRNWSVPAIQLIFALGIFLLQSERQLPVDIRSGLIAGVSGEFAEEDLSDSVSDLSEAFDISVGDSSL